MKLTLDDIQNMVNESVKRILRERKEWVVGHYTVDFDKLIELLPDSTLKTTLTSWEDDTLYRKLERFFEPQYVLTYYGEKYIDKGDYYLPPTDEFVKIKLGNDAGLKQSIDSIPDTTIKEQFLIAYQNLMKIDDEEIDDWEIDY